eukprot:g17899.t1
MLVRREHPPSCLAPSARLELTLSYPLTYFSYTYMTYKTNDNLRLRSVTPCARHSTTLRLCLHETSDWLISTDTKKSVPVTTLYASSSSYGLSDLLETSLQYANISNNYHIIDVNSTSQHDNG